MARRIGARTAVGSVSEANHVRAAAARAARAPEPSGRGGPDGRRRGAPANAASGRDLVNRRAFEQRRLRLNDKLADQVVRQDSVQIGTISDRAAILGMEVHDLVELWRIEGAKFWWEWAIKLHPLEGTPAYRASGSATLQDWTLPFVHRELILADRADWNRFWYRDAITADMPRNWMRWALPRAQTNYRVRADDTGIAGDQQLSSYLTAVDLFATADRRFSLALEDIRRRAPVPFARVAVLSAQGEILRQIEHQLSNAEGAVRPET